MEFHLYRNSECCLVCALNKTILVMCFKWNYILCWTCRYNGWYAGYQVGYNTSSAKLMANNIAAGYTGSDFNVHARL